MNAFAAEGINGTFNGRLRNQYLIETFNGRLRNKITFWNFQWALAQPNQSSKLSVDACATGGKRNI